MQVLRLPMSFFDSQPAGRLLNRFSQDTESTDVAVRETIAWCLTCVGELIAPSFVWGSCVRTGNQHGQEGVRVLTACTTDLIHAFNRRYLVRTVCQP